MSREDGFRDHGLCERCSSAPCLCDLQQRMQQAPIPRFDPPPTILQPATLTYQGPPARFLVTRNGKSEVLDLKPGDNFTLLPGDLVEVGRRPRP